MDLLFACIGIFLARIVDVSLGTVRTIVMVKGENKSASLIAFIEIFIWYMAARKALNTTNNGIIIAIFYSLGYATGTYIGGMLSKVFIKGNTKIEVISDMDDKSIEEIRDKGYSISIINLEKGIDNKNRKMLLFEIDNNNVKRLQRLIYSHDKNAFIVTSEIKTISNGFIK
jgi:uncharacterized protein YebE (UPF0316 family)